MKKLIFISILMAFVAQLSAQVVNIPDAVFKSKLKIYDTNNNGEIEVSEGLKIDTLMNLGVYITSLTGIESFKNLRKLNVKENYNLQYDYSKLTKLEYLNFSGNKTLSLSLADLLNLKYLNCEGCQIKTISLKNLPNLEYLNCANNQFPDIDLSSFPTIRYLNLNLSKLITLDITKLGELKELIFSSDLIKTFDLSKSIKLERLDIYSKITSLSLKNCTKLIDLKIAGYEINNLELGTLPLLKSIYINYIKVTSLNLENFVGLQSLQLFGAGILTNLNILGCKKLKILVSEQSELSELNLQDLSSLDTLKCSTNKITNLNISGAVNIRYLDCSSNLITSLDLKGLDKMLVFNCQGNKITEIKNLVSPNLIYLNLSYNLLTQVMLGKLPKLIGLQCNDNSLFELDVTDLSELKYIICDDNKIERLYLKNTPVLESIDCENNLMTSFRIDGHPSLSYVRFDGNKLLKRVEISNMKKLKDARFNGCVIDTMVITNNKALKQFQCQNSNLKSLSVINCENLLSLFLDKNKLNRLNIIGCDNINTISVNSNLFNTLDFSKFIYLAYFKASDNPNLTYLNIKNGQEEEYSQNGDWFNKLPKLNTICCDDIQKVQIKAECNAAGLKNININSDCEGGRYLLTGKALLDINNNGCDDKDILFPNSSLDIVNGLAQKRVINDASGKYSVILPIGTYDVMPSIEKSDYFKCKTQPFNVVFPVANSNMISKDICITPIGNVSDLEIALIPINSARPGFVSDYQIIVKNNGNSYENPTVNFSFDGNIIKFEKSDIVPSSQSSGKLAWSLSNIIPLETRLINFSLRLNKPTDIPAVNGDDILLFNVNLSNTPNDANTYDNYANLSQTVVNSFDPNDKTCLEGERIELSKDGNTLHYMIRFENTGSANAENIVVRDQIDTTKFILKSLKMVRASHNCTTEINQNGLVEFLFNNIQLPFTEPDKHGYILFKIKTKPNLPLNDSLKNQAKIYFDFNFPIVTNVAKSALVKTVSTTQFELSPNINLFPNPANEYFNLNLDANKPCTVNIFDQYGRVAFSETFDTQNISINTSKFNNGVYFVKLNFSNSSVRFVRLVVQH